MTKRNTVLLIVLLFLLAACSGGEVNNEDPVVINEDPVANNEDSSQIEEPEYSPAVSAATCTATSASIEIALEPYDHITGALEDYKITLVEYGDFQ